MPPMTTVASGRCTSAPAPVAIAMGTKPSEATSAVINTAKAGYFSSDRAIEDYDEQIWHLSKA